MSGVQRSALQSVMTWFVGKPVGKKPYECSQDNKGNIQCPNMEIAGKTKPAAYTKDTSTAKATPPKGDVQIGEVKYNGCVEKFHYEGKKSSVYLECK
jgi:hypothetical protein